MCEQIPFNMSREMFEFEPTDEKGVKVKEIEIDGMMMDVAR